MTLVKDLCKDLVRDIPRSVVRSAAGGGAVSPTSQFVPSDLGARTKLWYHFDPAYMFTDSGKTNRVDPSEAVYTVEGLVASTDATQATLARRPALLESDGYFAARFSGAEKGLVITPIAQSLPIYCYLSVTPITLANNPQLLGRDITGGSPFSPSLNLGVGTNGIPQIYWGTGNLNGSTALVAGTRAIVRFRVVSGEIGIRIDNGVEVVRTTTASKLSSWTEIGDPVPYGIALNHDLHKMVLVHGAIDAAEDANLMEYMAPHTQNGAISGDNWLVVHPLPARYTNPPIVIFCHGSGVDHSYLSSYPNHTEVVAEIRKAGYMIASANLGGENWGNDASLDKLAAFIEYLNATYAPSRIILWGESMGGCVAQRAFGDARFDAIKGAYLTFPVCSLTSMNYGGFASLIAAAFPSGFAGKSPVDIDGSEFAGKRLRYTHSAGDTVVGKSANTDAMRAIIGPYATESGLVTTTGDHGHISNYDADDMISFFDRCL